MKNFKIYAFALVMGGMTFTSCSDDDNKETDNTNGYSYTASQLGTATDAVYSATDDADIASGTWTAAQYADNSYGKTAMDGCDALIAELSAANKQVISAALTDAQKNELRVTLAATVAHVIVPTYTRLADAALRLQQSLGDLSADEITQSNIDAACAAFKEARAWWEKSEAFLGGAASDFDIDPTIDSWPLNRDLLRTYFTTGEYSDDALDDASILGFHALEFVLFRNGQNRPVADFQDGKTDTYKGFTAVKASEELKYAQAVAKELVVRCYELQVSWQETPDAARLAAVTAARLDYQTQKGMSYGWNLYNAGNSKSTFSDLNAALSQLLANDEGSCVAIADEVGGGKIGHPYAAGYVFYVESPYSYNSIVDFRNNIRSIENVWYGNLKGKSGSATHSLHNFFTQVAPATAAKVETAIENAINGIAGMPYPFVTYVETLHGKKYEDDDRHEVPEDEE